MSSVSYKKELAQLAHLLRTCADVAKEIAWSLPKHANVLLSISTGVSRMAKLVENIEG